MDDSTCSNSFCCNPCLVILLIVLACVWLPGAFGIAVGWTESVNTLGIVRSPLAVVTAAVMVWALRMGYRHHGRGEPLAVALFGLALVAVGFVTLPALALVGACIALGAAFWGALLPHASPSPSPSPSPREATDHA